MTAPKITVVGSVNMDLIATARTLPRPGKTVLGQTFSQVPGGKGANQAVAAVRAGAQTTFLGAIGSDSFGVTLRGRLAASNVDISLLRTIYGASGVALIVVDDDGENAIVVAPGANALFADLTAAEFAAIAGADVLLCQLETPVAAVVAAATAARGAGTTVVLNASPARELPAELFALVDLLVVNEGEAATLIAGAGPPHDDAELGVSPDPTKLLDELLELVPRVVVTQGAQGAWFGTRGGDLTHVPAPVVDAVDTTGAGDAFAGGLAVALGEGRELLDAIRWASAAGAGAALRLGASVALPRRSAIDDLYAATYLSQNEPGITSTD